MALLKRKLTAESAERLKPGDMLWDDTGFKCVVIERHPRFVVLEHSPNPHNLACEVMSLASLVSEGWKYRGVKRSASNEFTKPMHRDIGKRVRLDNNLVFRTADEAIAHAKKMLEVK